MVNPRLLVWSDGRHVQFDLAVLRYEGHALQQLPHKTNALCIRNGSDKLGLPWEYSKGPYVKDVRTGRGVAQKQT